MIKNFYIKVLTFTVAALLSFFGNDFFAQKDTTFWFSAPEIASSEGDSPIILRLLSYNNATTVTISLPANGAFTPIVVNLPANAIDSVDLTSFLADIESPAGNVISNNGLKIQSTEQITAYYELTASNNREIFSLKGSQALGTNFYTPFQNFWNTNTTTPASFSAIEIVASQNNTTVLITPKTAIIGHVANTSFTVVLNEGQTYSARNMNLLPNNSLSGSIVSANKPIAITVFSGALSSLGCNSSMGDQITPTDYIGTDYIINRGSSSSEKIFILSTENATSLTIEGNATTSTLINWSETYTYDLTDSITYIHSSKPIYIWHASGNGCNLSGAQVPNLFCAGTYSTNFSRATADSLNLFLFVKTGFEGSFELNGNSTIITASLFRNVPGTNGGYKAANVYLPTSIVAVNSFNQLINTGDVFGMSILNGANTNGSGYAYLSEYTSYPFIDAGNTDTVCANTVLNLSGVVGGGDITGLWSSSGFGSFLFGNDTLSNQYVVSVLDTAISPIDIILSTTGKCTPLKDTVKLYITPSPFVNANADQTVCANNATVQLNGNVFGGALSGIWTTSGNGNFMPNDTTLNAIYVPDVNDTINGGVTLVLTSTNFGLCNVVTDTMKIFITPSPIVAAGVDTVFVCENNSLVNLNGSVAGATSTGKWTTQGNGLFLPDNVTLNADYQPSPLDVVNGSMVLYLESTNNGTCIADKDSLIIIFTPKPIVNAGPNLIACANNTSVQLNGIISGPTTTGFWSGGTGSYTVDSTDLTATYTPSAAEISAGSILLTLTSSNNLTCLAETDFVQINVVAPPFANFNFTNKCFGEAIDLTDFSLPGFGTINGWNWDLGDLATATTQNVNHTYTTASTYNVELIISTDVGCTDTIVKTIEVYELPTSNFSYTSDCSTNQIILDFTDQSTSNDPLNFWFYDFGTAGNSSLEHPIQLFTTIGNFNVTHIVGTINNCFDTVVQTIVIPPRPVAGFSFNTDNGLNIGATFNFIDTSANTISYVWNFGDGSSSIDQNPSNTYFTNGTYDITQVVTSGFGCTDSLTISIIINTVTEEISSLIPNAISPNGDGKNDVWKLDFLKFINTSITVDVFNRWGQMLFHSDGYAIPWDGTFEGNLVADGTYFYVINLNDNAEKSVFKGTILVLQNAK
ncbi:MAG: gliding motility-associated C-terminal domain-containing protein [Flavobacteriales bacterium]|nr:gliding motility-associated C-terminal domain-containing protein [Flavobacteriales bacterium]